MKSSAKVLEGRDNGLFYYEDAPKGVLCERCGGCIDWEYAPQDLTAGVFLRFDVSYTYDGRIVLSERVLEILSTFDHSPKILQIGENPAFFSIMPRRIYEFDAITRGTRFTRYCDLCNRYSEVAGATPAFLNVHDDIPGTFIARTDLDFGSGAGRSPLIIIGKDIADSIRNHKLLGAYFKDIFLREDEQ